MIVAYRVAPARYDTAERLDELLRFLDRFRAACDEVSLFTTRLHGYEALDDFRVQMRSIRAAIARIRAAGFRVGVNVLNTIGQFDEAPDRMPAVPWQPMVGHDGSVCRQCSCPSDPALHDDLRRRHTLLAEAHPDFIWIDDDMRMQHHRPVAFGCFCPRCVRMFCDANALDLDRDSLVRELARETWPEPHPLRPAWVGHCSAMLDGVLATIEQAVHAHDPSIELGLMTAGLDWAAYNGPDYASRMRVLRGPADAPVRLRPGGSFYNDECLIGMVHKAIDVMGQVAEAGPGLASVQYEQESFPYHRLMKSVHTLLVENTLALAAGCDGIANNVLSSLPDPIDDYAPILDGIARRRPMWDALVEACDGLPLGGLWLGLANGYAARARTEGRWPEGYQPDDARTLYVLGEIGLPLCAAREPACATVLADRLVTGLSRDELESLLGGGVLIDHEAAALLWEIGLGELTGVRPTPIDGAAVVERLTDHPINGAYAGHHRDGRLGFVGGTASRLDPVDNGVEVLSELVTSPLPGRSPEHLGPALTAYENARGGRVAVLGYQAWRFIHCPAKVGQMRTIADWVACGRLPVHIETCVKVVPFVRLSADRLRCVLVLLNASLDPTGPVRLHVRVPPGPLVTLEPDGMWSTDRARVVDEKPDEVLVELDSIAPWSIAVIARQ